MLIRYVIWAQSSEQYDEEIVWFYHVTWGVDLSSDLASALTRWAILPCPRHFPPSLQWTTSISCIINSPISLQWLLKICRKHGVFCLFVCYFCFVLCFCRACGFSLGRCYRFIILQESIGFNHTLHSYPLDSRDILLVSAPWISGVVQTEIWVSRYFDFYIVWYILNIYYAI